MPQIQRSALFCRPKYDCLHVLRLTPLERCREQPGADALAALSLTNIKVGQISMVLRLDYRVGNLSDELHPEMTYRYMISFSYPAPPESIFPEPFLHPKAASLHKLLFGFARRTET